MSLDISLVLAADVGTSEPYNIVLFSANITHNVAKMWVEADCLAFIYGHSVTNEREDVKRSAKDLIEPLRLAKLDMLASPDKYRKFNIPNGWGTYEQALDFLSELLEACEQFPKATVEVFRLVRGEHPTSTARLR